MGIGEKERISVRSYGEVLLPHLKALLDANAAAMEKVATRLCEGVRAGQSLFVAGSGHSSIFAFELYHRAGGASFVIPVVENHLLPTAGPPVVRLLERTPGTASNALRRANPKAGEMLWICSQSGINAAVVELALDAGKLGLHTVAFTSLPHSKSVASRHSSGKRLFEICDDVVDLQGVAGDAAIQLDSGVSVGPFSSLGAITLAHSILVTVTARLEAEGFRCVYTSVNTPEGENRNHGLEEKAKLRDPLLR